MDIQGMVAVQYDKDSQAVYVVWGCTAPENNISEFGALPLPPVNNPYRFMLSDAMTEKIREVYSYEWTDEEI